MKWTVQEEIFSICGLFHKSSVFLVWPCFSAITDLICWKCTWNLLITRKEKQLCCWDERLQRNSRRTRSCNVFLKKRPSHTHDFQSVKTATYLRRITGLFQPALSQAQLSARELRASRLEHKTGQTHNGRIENVLGRGMWQPRWWVCNKTNRESFHASTKRKVIHPRTIYSSTMCC